EGRIQQNSLLISLLAENLLRRLVLSRLPPSSQHTASPSTMQERDRWRARGCSCWRPVLDCERINKRFWTRLAVLYIRTMFRFRMRAVIGLVLRPLLIYLRATRIGDRDEQDAQIRQPLR